MDGDTEVPTLAVDLMPGMMDSDLAKPVKDLTEKWKLLPSFLQVR